MFKIYGNKDSFFQWDLNQKLVIEDDSITEVHYCNKTDDCALVCEVYKEGALNVVDVPNILLQYDKSIRAYAVAANHTEYFKKFKVISRSKPADYVYTATEIKTFSLLEEKIKELEASMTIEGVKGAVEEYLKENPVEAGATEEQAAQIEANRVAIGELEEAIRDIDIPSGGSGGSSEMQEIFRLTTTEEVGMIETGIDLSQYAEVVAMCKTSPIEGTTANTHFDWYVSKGYAQRIMTSLHNTQKRIQIAHITRLSSKKAICRLGYGAAQGSLFVENTNTGSANNSADIDMGQYIRIVLDNLNNNFKFGSYGGKTPLIIGTEVLIYGRK